MESHQATSSTKLTPETVRHLAHGLRNGLASVRAGANMLLHSGSKPAVVERVAQGLQQQVIEMLQLLDELIGAPAAERAPPMQETSRGSPLSVLIADDNVDAASTLATCLRLDGHHAAVTFDGADVMRMASIDPPQVMLLDISMPTKDGYQLAREIRSQPWGSNVRLIAVSGWFAPEDRQRALQAGFDELVAKPIDMDVLQRLLPPAR